MASDLPVHLSFLPGWYDAHFFTTHERPPAATDEAQERLYLQRKRFLHDHFAEFGIGEADPVADGKWVNRISKFCCDFIPYLLGVRLKCMDVGFYHPQPLSEQQIRDLKPVDLATSPLGRWILERKATLSERYGSAAQGLYLEGSLNAAARVRGEEIYADLYLNQDLVHHLFDVINETVLLAYRFLAPEFDMGWVTLFNCTANHIGPDLYEKLCLPNDLYVVEQVRKLVAGPHIHLHHCDLPVDPYRHAYGRIPHLGTIDGSHTTDIAALEQHLGDVRFLALVNPMVIAQTPLQDMASILAGLLEQGADDLFLIHIDAATDIERLRSLLDLVRRCGEQAGRRVSFDVAPLCEEELEWAFPRYQGEGLHHRDDDWRELVPSVGG